MKVNKFKYELKALENFRWNGSKFDWIDLQNINLIVGKNASGKTTISNILANFSRVFLPSQGRSIGVRAIELEDKEGNIYLYSYSSSIEGIDNEQLFKNGEILIDRAFSKARIFSNVKNEFEEINPPADKPVIQVRRDAKEYPYLEEIATWADGIHSFKFGNVHPHAPGKTNEFDRGFTAKDFDDALETLKNNDKKIIIDEFNSLGYDLKVIEIRKESNQNIIFIKEGNLKYELRQSLLSQGMFRSLSILIYLHYIIKKQGVKLIIIDDLCEGLDFERATNLGKLVFEKMKDNNIQFVATSNDFFLMNVVDISYWNIVKRVSNTIKMFNNQNSKDKFDNFKFTGLNNFQLFASNYLEEELV